ALGDVVLRHTERPARSQLLQGRLPVEPGAEPGGLVEQAGEHPEHELTRGFGAAVEVERADQRLDGVGKDRGLVPAATGLLTAAEPEVAPDVELAGDLGEGARV